MKSVDGLKGCKDLCYILQLLENKWGRDVSKQMIRQGGDSEASN